MALHNSLNEDNWTEKSTYFKENYSPCRLCPRECNSERDSNIAGVCRVGKDLRIASYNLHFGEEPPISGARGSGTIFFSGCTLKCIYCQNFPISQLDNGKTYSIEDLTQIFLELKERGAHNINLVSPSPYLFHIVSALRSASMLGFDLPIVYNSGGYERVEIIKNLNKIIDVYMPDFKYSYPEISKKYSGVSDYSEMALNSISEMYRQVGSLQVNEEGIAVKGVIIRHLILPGHIDNSKNVLEIISENTFNDSYLSLMSQYFPAYNSSGDEHLKRRLTPGEYEDVKSLAISKGLVKGWFQDI